MEEDDDDERNGVVGRRGRRWGNNRHLIASFNGISPFPHLSQPGGLPPLHCARAKVPNSTGIRVVLAIRLSTTST